MSSVFCFLKGCTKCNGDLVFDEGDWHCWQCGHYYYSGGVPTTDELSNELMNGTELSGLPEAEGYGAMDSDDGQEQPKRGRRRGYGSRYSRSIDAVIRVKQASDQKWWVRNRQIIDYIDQGLSIREISKLAECGERQIRVVRERLYDMRAASTGSKKGK